MCILVLKKIMLSLSQGWDSLAKNEFTELVLVAIFS